MISMSKRGPTTAGCRSVCRRWLVHAMWLLMLSMCLPACAADDYLDPEAAFRFSAVMKDGKTVAVSYAIADGYYMYRERFAFQADGATLRTPAFPNGKVKFDETFQKNVETYRHAVTIDVPVRANGNFTLNVTAQGCADKGLCYSPMTSKISLSPTGGGLGAKLREAMGARQDQTATATPQTALPAASGVLEYQSRTATGSASGAQAMRTENPDDASRIDSARQRIGLALTKSAKPFAACLHAAFCLM